MNTNTRTSLKFVVGVVLVMVLCMSTLLQSTLAMDKSKFENCDQKGFCKRLRGSSKKSSYIISGQKIENGVFTATLENKEEGTTFDPLTIVIESYENGIFRMKIQEKAEAGTKLQNRYNVKDVIVDTVAKVPVSESKTNVLTNGMF